MVLRYVIEIFHCLTEHKYKEKQCYANILAIASRETLIKSLINNWLPVLLDTFCLTSNRLSWKMCGIVTFGLSILNTSNFFLIWVKTLVTPTRIFLVDILVPHTCGFHIKLKAFSNFYKKGWNIFTCVEVIHLSLGAMDDYCAFAIKFDIIFFFTGARKMNEKDLLIIPTCFSAMTSFFNLPSFSVYLAL